MLWRPGAASRTYVGILTYARQEGCHLGCQVDFGDLLPKELWLW